MGLIVPRHRQSAVARNRLKRQLRELTRLRLLPTHLPFDVVVRARPESYGAAFEQLGAEIDRVRSQLERWARTIQEPDPSASPSSSPSAP